MGMDHPRRHSDFPAEMDRPTGDRFLRHVGGGLEANGQADEAAVSASLRETRSRASCHFDLYRADQVRTSSTLFSGGDWHWRLSDGTGRNLVEAGGYRSEEECREAVQLLQRHTPFATMSRGSDQQTKSALSGEM